MFTLFTGIDVAKLLLQICAMFPDGTMQEACFDNNATGRKKLIRWLQKIGQGMEIRVCMESTGSYHGAIACQLCEAEIWVAVLNPRTVKHFAISLGARNKNDLVDARIIARFGKERDPKRWSLADPLRRELCQLLAQMDRLHKTIRIHENPLEDESLPKTVVESCKSLAKTMKREYAKMEARVVELSGADDKLSVVVEAVSKVKGIGMATALQFSSRVDVEAYSNAQQVGAFAGLNPSQRQSGNSQGRTVLSKQGDAALRKAFYFPAITAARHNPDIRAFAQRLKDKNKSPKAIRAACMRKLIMICYGVAKRALKGQQPFYPA